MQQALTRVEDGTQAKQASWRPVGLRGQARSLTSTGPSADARHGTRTPTGPHPVPEQPTPRRDPSGPPPAPAGSAAGTSSLSPTSTSRRSSSCSWSRASSRSPTRPGSRCMDWDLVGRQGHVRRLDQNFWTCCPAELLLEQPAQHLQHLPALERPAAHPRALHRGDARPRTSAPRPSGAWACCCPTSSRPSPSPSSSATCSATSTASINTVLGDIGIDAGRRGTATAFASHIAIATMVNFRWTGYNTLILLAAMQAIPRDYYEAAAIDGAGAVRQFFSHHHPDAAPDAHLRRSSPRPSAACRSSTSRACSTSTAAAAPTGSG